MFVDLLDTWNETLRRNPAALAINDRPAGRSWSRGELESFANSWVAALSDFKALRRRRVLVSQSNGAEWFRVFLGLLKVGAVPMPVDANESSERLREIADATGASWVWDGGRLQRAHGGRIVRSPDACLIKLTSGSTGTPKALVFSHSRMIADGRQVCSTMGIDPDDLNLGVIPFGHSYGLGNLVVPLLIQGTAIVSASGPLPTQLAQDCSEAKPTVFPAVPALLRLLVESDVNGDALASIRLVISAGSPLSPDAARAFGEKFKRMVHGFYGSSETGGICYDRSGEATLVGRSVGRPLDGVSLSFRNRGRFDVRSAAVVGRGIFAPKDRGELNDLGELVLCGRVGRMVKIAGRRLDLGEVESILRRVEGVKDAFVTNHPGREGALVAAVATNRNVMELRREMAALSASWKIPGKIIVLPELPLTARGKTDARKLRALIERQCAVR